jgi:hypothetical protein
MAEQLLSLGLVAMPLSKAAKRSSGAQLALRIGLLKSLEPILSGLTFQWATQSLVHLKASLHAPAASSPSPAPEPLPQRLIRGWDSVRRPVVSSEQAYA